MNLRRIVFLAVLISLLCVPALAGVKYLAGEPDLSAAIQGRNEFSPGEDVTLRVTIENRGLVDMKFVQSGIIEREDLPNTAKLVKATLGAGDSPFIIKADPQVVGDIPGGKSATVSFAAKIPSDAPSGNYTLPLHVRYSYLKTAEQYGQDAISYTYRDVEETIPLMVRVQPRAMLEVIAMSGEALNAGTEGYLSLSVRNKGYEDARDTVVYLSRNGNSPIVPTDSNIYIGEFPAGSTRDVRFRVSVSRQASEGSYPVDIFCKYTNNEGDTVTSDTVTVGVPVSGKISFAVVSPPAEARAGGKTVIKVVYENTGSATARDAQARISAVDPFSSNDDSAYLGDIAPGEKAVALYEVNVDAGAVLKEYGLDSEIRYRDALDNSVISDTMKVRVKVVSPGISPLAIAGIFVLVALAAGAVYYIRKNQKKG
ncbi:MAG TPA: COG1361 S-layer family protein [Methanolinea sp.]|nr:COG1361 S-layer family protein [Methanolinea sp.]